jgi:ketosteroid isomerase-like protein
MSQQNVEKLRAAYEAFNRGDFDGFVRYMDPEIEVHPGVMAPDAARQYLGRQAVRNFLVNIVGGPWEAVTAEPQEIIETEDGRVLSVDRWRFRGRDGIEVERELPNLYTFREGLILRIDGFTDRAEALDAAGLSEKDAHTDS